MLGRGEFFFTIYNAYNIFFKVGKHIFEVLNSLKRIPAAALCRSSLSQSHIFEGSLGGNLVVFSGKGRVHHEAYFFESRKIYFGE